MHQITPEQLVQHADRFVEVATCHANGDPGGVISLLDGHYGTAHAEARDFLWVLAGVGASVINTGIKRIAGPHPPGATAWAMAPPASGNDVHDIALKQAITAYLNDDFDAAGDVIAAHHAVHGDVGLYDVVLRAVVIAAGLIKLGGITPRPKGD